MRVYFIAMTIRIACVASLLFVRGWWILLVGLAAVILPYFAVIFANARASADGAHPEGPTPREITAGSTEFPPTDTTPESLLVVDQPAERRSAPKAAGERPEPAGEAKTDTPRDPSNEGAV